MTKIKKSEKRFLTPTQRWEVQALFLLHHSVRDVRDRLKCSLGAINRIVTEMNLDTVRCREDTRVPALLSLHMAHPEGKSRFIETEMERLTMTWANATALNVFRRDKDKPVEMNIAERVVVLRTGKGRRGDEANVNEAADALSWLLANRKIEEWQYDAGTAWRADIEAAQSFRGQEVGKDAVQGGLMAGTISDSQAMAIERLGEVREAIVLACPGGLIGQVFKVAQAACVGMSARQADSLGMLDIARIRVALEPIAWVYGLAPSGDVSTRLSAAAVNGRLRKRGEIE